MIKIICFIFGHKRTWKAFTGKYGMTHDRLTGEYVQIPIMVEQNYKKCPRCGAKL